MPKYAKKYFRRKFRKFRKSGKSRRRLFDRRVGKAIFRNAELKRAVSTVVQTLAGTGNTVYGSLTYDLLPPLQQGVTANYQMIGTDVIHRKTFTKLIFQFVPGSQGLPTFGSTDPHPFLLRVMLFKEPKRGNSASVTSFVGSGQIVPGPDDLFTVPNQGGASYSNNTFWDKAKLVKDKWKQWIINPQPVAIWNTNTMTVETPFMQILPNEHLQYTFKYSTKKLMRLTYAQNAFGGTATPINHTLRMVILYCMPTGVSLNITGQQYTLYNDI